MSFHNVVLVFLLTFLLKGFIAGSNWNLEEERLYPTPVKDSALLPYLLESLSAQKHSPDTSHEIKVEYDYIIVGAGAAGSVIASRLSEVPCVNVLLLEAGPPPPLLTDIVAFGGSFLASNIDWKYESTPQRYTGRGQINRKVPLPSAKCLGGSTTHNYAVHVRGNKKDYDDWEMMGAEGWNYEKVLPYFIKLEDNKEYRDEYHGCGGPITVQKPRYISEVKQPLFEAVTAMGYQFVDSNSRRQTGFYDFQANMRHGQRCSTAKGYLVPVENRTNLDILPNALVTKVVIKNNRAVGVLFDYNGRAYMVHARREVVLSAGAINSPQILMLSGIGPEEHLRQFNIPVFANLPVGMNYHDHAAMSIAAVLHPHIEEFGDKLSDEAYIKEYILYRTGPLAGLVGETYDAFLHNDEINPETDFPNYQIVIGESSAKTAQMDGNLKQEVYQQVYGPYRNSSMMTCFAVLLHPKSRGRIQLRSENPYEPPIINPNYLADPRDVEVIVEGLKTCKRIYERPEMKQVIAEPFQTLYPGCEEFSKDDNAYFRCIIHTVVYSYNHYCCSAKMGNIEDPTTVLDPQLRVKYIKGLRVADTSVMPKITSGNTGVPTIMIGEKAADMIKETIQCEDVYYKDENYHSHHQNAAESKSAAWSRTFGEDKSFGKSNAFAEFQ